MDTSDSKIVFDKNGVCDHCNTYYSDIEPNWNPNDKGWAEITEIAARFAHFMDVKDHEKGAVTALMCNVYTNTWFTTESIDVL